MSSSILEDIIIREYLLEKNMKIVAKKLSLPVKIVRRTIISRCSHLYKFHGLCRVYLYMIDKCFASAREVASALRTKYQNIYRAFSELEKKNLELKVVKVHRKSRVFVYIVWNKEKCLSEFNAKLNLI
ncbi:MAG: hypothetical protein QXL19_05825 [Ignisphaera sp.]